MPRSGIRLYGAVVLSFVIPTDCDFLISLNGLLWMERASLLLNNHPVPWQRSSLLHHPLLFVIPSEAEGSAVRSIGNQSEMEASPSPCHPERLSELSSDRQCSPSRVKLKLQHLSSPWTGAPCLHRRSGGTTWVEQDGAEPLPLFSFACSEARKQKAP
jgi:hypothetical protein